jgi:hypothetical protein
MTAITYVLDLDGLVRFKSVNLTRGRLDQRKPDRKRLDHADSTMPRALNRQPKKRQHRKTVERIASCIPTSAKSTTTTIGSLRLISIFGSSCNNISTSIRKLLRAPTNALLGDAKLQYDCLGNTYGVTRYFGQQSSVWGWVPKM